MKKKLKSLVERLELKNKVEFLGYVADERLYELYSNSHIFLLPSVTSEKGDREGQGLVIQEAQASGLPVVSTLHNGIPEGVRKGESALLVPERDVDALAEKLEYLIENPERWIEMGRAGRRFVEKKYDIKKLNDKLEEIYQGLLNRN